MSIYNHRPMVPSSQTTRLMETLDTIKSQFEQLAQEAYICRSQKEEYENKIALQLKEMHKIRQTVLDLERNQQIIKKQYEDEIARLHQQLERTSNSNIKQEQPPNIGPASNYFASIINTGLEPPVIEKKSPFPPHSPEKCIIKQPVALQQSPKPQALASPSSTISLIDIDPNTLGDNYKTEGSDWFALFNPKIKRSLSIKLYHSLHHNSVVCCVKFSMDGRYLAAGCNRITYVYDIATGQKVCMLKDESISQEGDLYIRSVSFSPDGRLLATGAEDKQIRIWDIATRRIRNILPGHSQDIYSLEFSRDGRILVSGSGDRTTRIWNMADGTCQHVLRINDTNQKDPGVTSVAISYDCRLVATGSLDKMVRVWDIQTGQLMEQLEGHRDSVYSVAFMPNENELISGSLDKTVKLWKLGTNANLNRGFSHQLKNPCKMTFVGHKDFVLSIGCSFDGKWVISGSKDRTVQFWDPKTGQPHLMLQGHKNSVISIAVSPDGRPLFASGSGDNYARIWSYS